MFSHPSVLPSSRPGLNRTPVSLSPASKDELPPRDLTPGSSLAKSSPKLAKGVEGGSKRKRELQRDTERQVQSSSGGDGDAEGNDRREACLVGDIEVASPDSSYRIGEQNGGSSLGSPLLAEAVMSEPLVPGDEADGSSKKKGKGKARAATAAGGVSSIGKGSSSGGDTGAVLGGEVSVGTERSNNAPGELSESAVKKGAREEAIASLVEFFRSSTGERGGQTGDGVDSSPVEGREQVDVSAAAAAAAAEALATAVATAGGNLVNGGVGVRSMGGEEDDDDEVENDDDEGNNNEEEDEEIVDTEGIGSPDDDLGGGRNAEDVWSSLLGASISGGSINATTVAAAASASSANREVTAEADEDIGNGERKLAGGLKAWQVAFVLEVAEGEVLSAWSRTLEHSVSSLKGE